MGKKRSAAAVLVLSAAFMFFLWGCGGRAAITGKEEPSVSGSGPAAFGSPAAQTNTPQPAAGVPAMSPSPSGPTQETALDSASAASEKPQPPVNTEPSRSENLAPQLANNEEGFPTQKLVPYRGEVERIFFHPLIVYPELAFDGDRLSKGYDDWFVTVPEFKRVLEDLYRNGYVLTDIRSLYKEEETQNGPRMTLQSLMLPEGKKPLVLSVDDLNYYDYMIHNGNNRRLVLDEADRIAAESVTPDGKTAVSQDNEIVPIVDDFVEKHPDFSFHGAKGLLALTGYEGVLGYRTQAGSPNRDEEREKVLPVIAKLKETGWTFASHSWGHPDAQKADASRMARDTNRWKEEVEPLTGPTSVYVYPYGERLKHSDPKFKLLTEAGFRVFCGVGPAPYLRAEGDVLEMDRRHVDGVALRTQAARLASLFDAKKALDERRP